MKKVRMTVRSTLLAVTACLLASPVAWAGVEAECRQEAADYGVDVAQLEEYVADCIDSRGGEDAAQYMEENLMPGAENAAMQNHAESE